MSSVTGFSDEQIDVAARAAYEWDESWAAHWNTADHGSKEWYRQIVRVALTAAGPKKHQPRADASRPGICVCEECTTRRDPRQTALEAIDYVRNFYSEDIFPETPDKPHTEVYDAEAASVARLTCDNIRREFLERLTLSE